MQTKLSKNQKLILTVFTVLILAVKIGAIYYVLENTDRKANMGDYIISAFYYTLMLSLMSYLGYIGKGLKAMSAIFAAELFLVLITVLLGKFCSLSSLSLIYGILAAPYFFVLGSHCSLFTAYDLEFWQFFLLLIFAYAVFSAVGLISNKAFKKVRDNNEKI